MSKLFKAPSILTRIGATKDNGLSLGFHTNEIRDPDQKLLAFSLHQQFGYLLFKENDFQDEEIPTDNADEAKTPSQRLRAAIYVYWTKGPNMRVSFDEFYRRQMERIIDRVKENLE